MRILLFANPRSYFGIDMFFRIPNLGLCSLAGNIDKGLAEIIVLDLISVRENPDPHLKRTLKKFSPDVVGFSSMTFQYGSTLEYIKNVKEICPKVKIILGGYHVSVSREEIINSEDIKYIDFMIEGEGERSFNSLIRSLKNNEDFSGIEGLTFKRNGKIISNPTGKLIPPEEIKLPDRSVRLRTSGFHCMGYKSDAVETSRGCVFDCNFCCINKMYGKSYRKFSIERVLDDIRDAQKHGAKSIMFTDDNINLDGKRYKELCESITDAGLSKIKYLTQAGVKGIKQTPGLAKAMADSGVSWVFLGIENSIERNLAAMSKSSQFSKSDIADVVGELKENGIIVIGGFVLGVPDDTEETMRENYNFARETGIDMPVYNIITPYPGTGIREEMLKQNLIINLSDYSKYDCYEVNIRTKHLTSDEIYKIRFDMEAKFPGESGAFFRMLKMYPSFFYKLILKWFYLKPSDFVKFAKGLFG